MVEQELHIPRMEGRDLFKKAVTFLPRAVRELCARHAVSLADIDLVVAHQANDRINEAVRDALGLPPEKVPSNIARWGNTSGGTIPILVDELRRDGRMKPGQLCCFLALGAGLHWGAALMRI
jgi:3-oxoacyl-[acyl-carrier-protein] synthase-3